MTKRKDNSIEVLTTETYNKINELINKGWEFTLHYGIHRRSINTPDWEADFTRKLSTGLWDNHMQGYGATPNIAIDMSYMNIKNGIKFRQ